jgi:hypothetical protein
LEPALARWPDDVEAGVTLAAARGAAGDRPGAVAAARRAVAAAPNSETALGRLAFEALHAGDLDTALNAADQLVEMNSISVPHLLRRVEVFLRRRDWGRAQTDVRAALAVQPLFWKSRLYLAVCRHHLADPAGAREEALTAAALMPSDHLRSAYMSWYREQTR